MSQSFLGELLVKITGSNVEFDQSIDKSENKLKSFSDSAKTIGGTLTKFVTLPLVGLGVAATKAFADSEDAEASFRASLMATGKQAEINVDNIKALTAEIQKNTVVEDDNALAALGMVQQLANLDENGLKAILPRLVDFSQAMKIDLNTAATMFGKAINGDTNSLGRFKLGIDDTTDSSDRLAAVIGFVDDKFKGYAETTAKLGSGPMKQLLNTLGDLAENFGAVILPVINDLIPPIKDAIKAFGDLDPNIKKAIVVVAALGATIGPVIGTVGNMASTIASLGASFVATFGPAGIAVLAIGATIAALAVLTNKMAEAEDKAIENLNKLKEYNKSSRKYYDQLRQDLSSIKLDNIITFDKSKTSDKLTLQIKYVENAIDGVQKKIDAINKQGFFSTDTNSEDLQNQLEGYKKVLAEILDYKNRIIIKKNNKETLSSGLEDFLIDKQQTELDILGKTIESKNMLLGVNDILGTQTSEILANAEQEAKAFNELYESYSKYTNLVLSSTGPIFEAFGTALVQGGDAWKAFAKAGVDAIASIVDALSNEALVQSAKEVALALASAASFNPVGAAGHTASAIAWGSAGALGKVVAGVIRAIPMADGGMIPATPGGQLVLAGEAGRNEFFIPEREDVMSRLANKITSNMQQPINNNFSPNIYNSINGPMVLSIDGQQFKAYINQQSAKGNIQISKSRGISRR